MFLQQCCLVFPLALLLHSLTTKSPIYFFEALNYTPYIFPQVMQDNQRQMLWEGIPFPPSVIYFQKCSWEIIVDIFHNSYSLLSPCQNLRWFLYNPQYKNQVQLLKVKSMNLSVTSEVCDSTHGSHSPLVTRLQNFIIKIPSKCSYQFMALLVLIYLYRSQNMLAFPYFGVMVFPTTAILSLVHEKYLPLSSFFFFCFNSESDHFHAHYMMELKHKFLLVSFLSFLLLLNMIHLHSL